MFLIYNMHDSNLMMEEKHAFNSPGVQQKMLMFNGIEHF